jgi:GTP cyclohydrolase I
MHLFWQCALCAKARKTNAFAPIEWFSWGKRFIVRRLLGETVAEDEERIEKALRELLRFLGEDTQRTDLLQTPKRMLDALSFLTRGLREKLDVSGDEGLFEQGGKDLVLLKDIEFVSLCEHHVLPFFGHAHVGFIPEGKIIGISKIAKVVDYFAARLQVQERMTAQIADCLYSLIKPKGLGVVVEALHLCMVARGVRKQDAKVITVAWRGDFQENFDQRQEFLRMLGR